MTTHKREDRGEEGLCYVCVTEPSKESKGEEERGVCYLCVTERTKRGDRGREGFSCLCVTESTKTKYQRILAQSSSI